MNDPPAGISRKSSFEGDRSSQGVECCIVKQEYYGRREQKRARTPPSILRQHEERTDSVCSVLVVPRNSILTIHALRKSDDIAITNASGAQQQKEHGSHCEVNDKAID